MPFDSSLKMNELQRFLGVCECKPVDRVPNHEAGCWPQTLQRWEKEGMDVSKQNCYWFDKNPAFNLDVREYIPFSNCMIPPYERELIAEDDETETYRQTDGVVTRALKEGTVNGGRMSMDTYLEWPVTDVASFRKMVKERYNPHDPRRYPDNWRETMLPRWKNRQHPLILGNNGSVQGFFWNAREWMGTEPVSYAWHEQPGLMHEMMQFIYDFNVEVAKPILAETDVEYVFINEDMAMKGGPFIGPNLYREFIFPHMKRLVEWYKSHGARYVYVDSDGDPELLIPLLMDAGVDGLWPIERASDIDPLAWRKRFGKSLQLWGGVDKREIAQGRKAIDAHLASLAPLVEEGGYIPTIDHTVPPDISYSDFCYYMERKQQLLRGEFK